MVAIQLKKGEPLVRKGESTKAIYIVLKGSVVMKTEYNQITMESGSIIGIMYSYTDEYICSNGKKLRPIYDRHSKNRNGYVSTVTIYECESCQGCPHKDKCIHGNNCKTPMEERNKRLNVSKVMKQRRQETLERITTEYGTQLRMNRNIQAEGSFAVIKEDMNFRRYLYRGKENVLAQSVLLAVAYNINKLHFKIQGGRTGQYLTELKVS